VSASDNRKEREDDEIWAEKKRGAYRKHPSCRGVLVIEQDRYEVRVDLRSESGWTSRMPRNPDDFLELASFGLSCRVADLYTGTPVQRHASR
jgi:hypothetical protein